MKVYTVELSVDLCNTVMGVYDSLPKAQEEFNRREKIRLQELEDWIDINNKELTNEQLEPHYEICEYEVK